MALLLLVHAVTRIREGRTRTGSEVGEQAGQWKAVRGGLTKITVLRVGEAAKTQKEEGDEHDQI